MIRRIRDFFVRTPWGKPWETLGNPAGGLARPGGNRPARQDGRFAGAAGRDSAGPAWTEPGAERTAACPSATTADGSGAGATGGWVGPVTTSKSNMATSLAGGRPPGSPVPEFQDVLPARGEGDTCESRRGSVRAASGMSDRCAFLGRRTKPAAKVSGASGDGLGKRVSHGRNHNAPSPACQGPFSPPAVQGVRFSRPSAPPRCRRHRRRAGPSAGLVRHRGPWCPVRSGARSRRSVRLPAARRRR